MAVIWMVIDKFGADPVKIDAAHPLAVAQRARSVAGAVSDPAATADTHPRASAAASVAPASDEGPVPDAPRRRRRA